MIEKSVETLIVYAKTHFDLDEEDALFKRNLLLSRFGAKEPYEGELDRAGIAALKLPDEALAPLMEDLAARGLDEAAIEQETTWAMGVLSPLPSEVNHAFWALYADSPKKATDYLYRLSIENDYVKKSKIDKNILWEADFPEGSSLSISINLSKPEKNNKDIAKLVHSVSTSYPKCALCHENLGFWGEGKRPARENIRMIPLTLAGQRWYLQYSPYGYFDEHLICLYDEHVPMRVCRENFAAELSFVEQFPHYFIGSNSDLPIVGGSILNHEHFQGGLPKMPLLKAEPREEVGVFDGIRLEIVDFYDTVLRLHGKDKEKLLDLAEKILLAWRAYDDPTRDILSHDGEGQHSTATSLAEKRGDEYFLWLILRNNRCDERYPDGIFHAHPEYHAIKKEGIGLIEAAGLFILPPRLKRQMAAVEDVLSGKTSFEEAVSLSPDLSAFKGMVETCEKKGMSAREYINDTCRGILRNVAVFKEGEDGQAGLRAFLERSLRA